jgi:iron-sulfur cluster assembly protein
MAMIANRSKVAPVDTGHHIGDERLIKITPQAATKIGRMLAARATPSGVLRVAVIGGGCSGLSYKMELESVPQDRDIMVESSGIRVVVDPRSAIYVTGSELDYVESLEESGFKFHNPNAASTCSCGDSFSV